MSETFVPDIPLKDKKVAVLGFGVEGKSVVDFLLEHGAVVTVFDEKDASFFDTAIISLYKARGVLFHFGSIRALASFDFVVRSPGIPLRHRRLVEIEDSNVFVTSSTKLFFDLCPAKVIGVTGTKGKGTTSTLIYEVLKRGGYDVHLAGNIGKPMLSLLPRLTPESYVVLELSSFQLIDLHKSPYIAVLLMVVPEHLDYHNDVLEYIEAKRNLVRFQDSTDYAIFNHDFPPSNESDICSEAQPFYISREHEVEGCFVSEGAIYTRINGVDSRVIDVSDIKLVGSHNLENVCAATLVSILLGIQIQEVAYVLRRFEGLEHRLEFVREVEGVSYYNDSFSTIPETTIAAVQSFEAPQVLILGGSSKKSDFEELGRVINDSSVCAIIGIGEEWGNIKTNIKNQKIKVIEGKTTMKEIVRAAQEVAEPGDVVLLSPACASFDMFVSYKERGRRFKEEVGKLT